MRTTDEYIKAMGCIPYETPSVFARFRDALEFYADLDGDGYRVTVGDYGLSTEEGEIVGDNGKRARAALNAQFDRGLAEKDKEERNLAGFLGHDLADSGVAFLVDGKHVDPTRVVVLSDRTDLDGCKFCSATRRAAEPFGYWVTQKHADPVLLRKPAYIPEPSDLRTVTPLYAATPSPGDGFTLEQWRDAGKRLSECMEHGKCTEGELISVVFDALGIPSIKPELLLGDMLAKKP